MVRSADASAAPNGGYSSSNECVQLHPDTNEDVGVAPADQVEIPVKPLQFSVSDV